MQPMKRIYQSMALIFLSTLFLLGSFTPTAAENRLSQVNDFINGPEDSDELSGFVDGVLAASMHANHTPGAVVVIVKDGEVIFSRGYGYADLEKRTPVDPAKTLFRPGSVSKLFTWTAVMQLVEHGKLDLNTDVNTYLNFEIPETFPEPIMLTHLMTHTAGFEDRGEGLFKLEAGEMISLEDFLKRYVPNRIYPAGTVAAYSNYGTALAGYIVERVSGLPFDAYVEENIFKPLGMAHSTFRQPLPESIAGEISGGYGYGGGRYLRGKFEYIAAYPAGGLSASGLDMARFMLAHLQDGQYSGGRILGQETARKMHSKLYSPDPRVSGMAYGFFEASDNGQTVISHEGDTLLFHSGLYLLLNQNLGMFISTNGTQGGSVVDDFYTGFMNHYFSTAEAHDLKAAAGFSERAAKYVGDYYSSRNNFTTLEKSMRMFNRVSLSTGGNDDLVLNLYGKPIVLTEVEPGLLVSVDDPDQKMVIKEDNGQVIISGPYPFIFIKTPLYASGSLHQLILIGGALLFLIALVRWIPAGLRRKKAGEYPASKLSRLARLVAGAFGLLFLTLMIALGMLFMSVNPAYGVPDFFFSTPGWFNGLLGAQLLLIPFSAAMIILSIIAWRRRYWTANSRVFYTVLTAFAAAIVWSLAFWRFII